ncbi:MAG TPA: TGS domain-containing protein, partial [Dehalococcoidia bacterium]|nr:TGS domain-containing protein [Dehalococcoidia bacterium]
DMPPITDRDAKPWFSHLLRNADGLLIVVDLCDEPLLQVEAITTELENMKVKFLTGEVEEELMPGVVRKRTLIIGNKVDLDSSGERCALLTSRYGGGIPVVAVSAKDGVGLEEMKQAVFNMLDIIRVYTKAPGKKPEFEEPVVLRRGSTVEDAAESVHKDFRSRLRYAQVWGSGKFDGQRVKRGHILEDGDVVELHT